MQHGTAHHERLDIICICCDQKLSMITGESTDISTKQMLAVVVQYLDTKAGKVADSILDLVEVEDATRLGLFTAV